MQPEPLGISVVLALFEEQLGANGYETTRSPPVKIPGDQCLVAEDQYNVIAVTGFATWAQLASQWPDAQSALVELLASRLSKAAPKAWDGYLVLICESTAPHGSEVTKIERDTTRVRKILGTSETLRTTNDVLRLLDPFLPLPTDTGTEAFEDILEMLPEIMRHEVAPDAVEEVIRAFRALEPPLERLHARNNRA
jgi:hypothetical protein